MRTQRLSNGSASWLVAVLLLALGPVGAAWAQVSVTAADPSSAPQGTVGLDVTISGNGFDSSAAVTFLVSGTFDTGGITVKKVVVRGSKKLVATIDVADSAVVNKFDIEVTLSGGRKGKGTTLFQVVTKTNSDPCSTPGLDFPAFIYWQQSGKQQQIYVADVTGKCSRPVIKLDRGADGARFSIVGNSNVGRVVFPDVANRISAVDFTFTGTTISVQPKRTVSPEVWSVVDLSKDGDYLYASTHPPDVDTRAILQRYYVGTGDPQPVSDVYTAPAPWLVWGLSVSGDGSALYMELADNLNGIRRLVRVDIAEQTGTGVLAQEYLTVSNLNSHFPAADPVYPRFAYTYYLSGLNNCYQIKVTASDGTDLTVGQPRYGRSKTWLDGYILTTSYNPPTGSGRCYNNGYIARIDPLTSEEIYLVRGYSPEAR